MAARDSTPRPKFPAKTPATGTGTGTRPVAAAAPEPTESLHPVSGGWDEADDPAIPPPVQAPMGTRDEPPSTQNTRIDSPGARVRTPARRSAPPPLPRNNERAEDRVGQTLGAYRLLELIGKGGMGFVYRAEHARLGREVALKVLRADYAKRRDAVSRFFQEARTVNRIRHRNIVDVTDFIELDDGTTYIIMELLRGKSLGAWARSGAAHVDLPRALALLIQICDGLAAAHAVGVIHRDLKPDNVIIIGTSDGAEQVKLLDFGVAKLINRDDEDVGLETAAGSVIGTPAYMSPEQAGGLVVDHRADIYSLGAIMYELFCGQPLFRGRSFGEYVRKHLNELPVPPRQTTGGANLDGRVEHMLMRCLEKQPERRYQTAEDLRDELLHLLAGIETHEHTLDGARPRLPLPAGPASVSGTLTPPPGHSTQPPPGPGTLMAMMNANASGQHPSHVSHPGYGSQHPGYMSHPGGPGYVSYPGYGSQVSIVEAPRRTWLIALVAVAAIGVAVAAVFVAATRTGTPPVAQPLPAPAAPTQITEVAPAAPRAPVISVRIDAPMGSSVLAANANVVVCAAPCTVAIDPADGGSTVQRDFVVRKPGFVDHQITIDLADPPVALTIALEPVAAAADPSSDSRRTSRGDRTPPPPPVVVEDKPPPPPVVVVEDTPPPPPPDTTKKPPKTGPAVDPTATIDPFAPKKK
jgi:serine/threonine protein kinase